MRYLINGICGAILGVCLKPIDTPHWWFGMLAAAVLIIAPAVFEYRDATR